MNRRELITSGVAAVIGAPAAAQQLFDTPKQPTAEQNAQQYAICKERGHTPTEWGNMHGSVVVNSVFTYIPDHAPRPYPSVGAGEWQTCWYCKTRYRFVTTMEEEGK